MAETARIMPVTLRLRSASFEEDDEIPAKYTCDGIDCSPPLTWSGAPAGTESFALIIDDPDAPDPRAPRTVWVHWVVYNVPANITELPEAARIPHALEGRNDWDKVGYRGPCPPIGRHRYFHKVYALDTVLPDLDLPHKAELVEAMKGHVLAETLLIGTYERRHEE